MAEANRQFLFLLGVIVIAGCNPSTDGEFFSSAVQAVLAGSLKGIDARDHPRITDADLAALADATNVEYLFLDGTSIGDAGMSYVARTAD